MPRKELKHPHQVTDWLHEWGRQLQEPASMILIGSAGLLWHVARLGRGMNRVIASMKRWLAALV